MEVRNCRKCRRLFNYIGGKNICPACKDELERTFIQVREYIRNNPGNSLQNIADDNEVDIQQIRDWIREGRLEVSKASGIEITCEKCGAKILKGRFCDKCIQKVADGLDGLVKESMAAKAPVHEEGPAGPKMRFRKM